MASSGSFNTNTITYDSSGTTITTYFTFSWNTVETYPESNQTKISWKVTTRQSPSGYYRGVRAGSTTTVNGATTSTPSNKTVYNNTVVQSGTSIITHNEDGTKSFSANVKYKVGQTTVNCSGSSTFTLDPLARNTIVPVKVNGAWKNGKPFIKVNGAWKQASAVYVKVNGTWKECSTRG